jgi:RHS repeat-associated protein
MGFVLLNTESASMADQQPNPPPNQINGSAPSAASSAFTPPQISLPKGGGAIRGIGEKFAANPATGTGSLSVPMALTPGRSGFSPKLSLSYDSGLGNGPFGIGWSLSLPSITRKTDKGLPQYRDSEESDVFILSGAEDLVPVLKQNARGDWAPDETERDGYRIRLYRPRVEGLFARIERWTHIENGEIHWRSISKDNIVTFYGREPDSRIFDPANASHIFSWLICQSFDSTGNGIIYQYIAESNCGVDLTRPNERNRQRPANRYLKRIKYGNRLPLLLDPDTPSFRKANVTSHDLDLADWMFEVVFDYGDAHYSEASPDERGRIFAQANLVSSEGLLGPVRRDPFSSYRAAFEVRTYRLCRRILMFHHFPDELGVDDYLVRSTAFTYVEKEIGSFLSAVTQSGFKRGADGSYLKKSLPPLDLHYVTSPLEDVRDVEFRLEEVGSEALENLPSGIDGTNYRWVDIDGEGISGVLSEQANSWFYKANLGNGRFAPTQVLSPKPSLSGINTGQVQLMDLAGDGNLDLVELTPPSPGYYERTLDEGWQGFRTFHDFPVRNWKDPNLRFVDLTGDGIADILVTEDEAFWWHPSLLTEGFGEAERVFAPHDEEHGPRVIFADAAQSIYLADMSGDGLSDIVRIRNGEVCYWPNLGYGRFGARVTMDNAPWFDEKDLFDQRRVHLADTDGSGTTDIIYFASESVRIFLNQSGNRWSDARVLEGFPATNDATSVSVVDFLGRGTACLLWSSSFPTDSRRPLRYVDLMCGRKPHLLNRTANNLGAETTLQYASSTEFYLADKAAGRPWVTRLPFPVHVVRRVETVDRISHNRFVTRYGYHHGYFDGVEREFRGFGMVEQLDSEEFAALGEAANSPPWTNESPATQLPPTLTKTWFHTGVYIEGQSISRHLEHEYYLEGRSECGESPLSPEERAALLLDDTVLPLHLTPEEAREACRSLKGALLRQEIYALDGTEKEGRPYSVAESNYTILPLQRREWNRHAVFFVHAREAIVFSYERELYTVDGNRRADPRVTHQVTLRVDDFGNVRESVSIGYGRRFAEPSQSLTADDRAKQNQVLLSLTENRYTNTVQHADAYRAPLLSESRTYQLIHLKPDARHFGITNLFRFRELETKVARASDGLHDLPYEDTYATGATAGSPYRRLIERAYTFYRSNALDRLLSSGSVESLALPGANYRLAFTPGVIKNVYQRKERGQPPENLLPDPVAVLGNEGGYVDLNRDHHWWVPAGKVYYSPDATDAPEQELSVARRHFFLPRRFHDPFGNISIVAYERHDLALTSTSDPLGNTTHAEIDYRGVVPRLVTDANGNRSGAEFDALGMLVGTAVMGKVGGQEGDSLEGFVADLAETTILEHIGDPLHEPHKILAKATTRLVYDLFAFQRTQSLARPKAPLVYTLARETHVADLAPGHQTKIQHSFFYSDGFAREIQKKLQAEPGPVVEKGPKVGPRWVGSGWIIYNNKGKAVRKYEPFFSTTQEFEFAKIVGVSAILIYDPAERVVAMLHPNHTFEKTVFDPWRQVTWDVNDTVLEKNPADDPDVGSFIKRLAPNDYLPSWYEQREAGGMGPAEQRAAAKAVLHAGTPSTAYFDALGRVLLTIDHNRFVRGGGGTVIEEYLMTRTELDIQGNQLSVIDALNRKIMSYDYDMIKTKTHHISADGGERWILNDARGQPLRTWDSRNHEFSYRYDSLRRQTDLLLKTGQDHEKLVERTVYGEGRASDLADNLRTRVFQVLDGAGVVTNRRYDFKGNLLSSTRQLLAHYRDADVDWSGSPPLEPAVFSSSTTFDALNRMLTSIAPDASAIRPQYNEANLLHRVDVNLRGAPAATPFVTEIKYNAKRQREFIAYGNGAHMHYEYDRLTFRLRNMRSTRQSDHVALQDLSYTYDPVGNVSLIHDAAQENVYFKNQVVSPSSSYTYDAVYRLVAAHGREHIGQLASPATTYDDSWRMNQALPGDGRAMRKYSEHYQYDAVGNIVRISHSAVGGDWTRHYSYYEPHAHPSNNRLIGTDVGDLHEHYTYDAHGNTTQMPHLPGMEWDSMDRLHATQRQVVKEGAGRKTYYVYNSAGQRVRKITERSNGCKAKERIYLGVFEVYYEYNSHGKVRLERDSLHVMDDKRRVALVETTRIDQRANASPVFHPLIRYQFGNHLDSAVLELDETALIISYEEYYPYGSTSYEAVQRGIEVSPKRYRHTGKERDEETGFYYHGARYCSPWLGRWVSCDPMGLVDGPSMYSYAKNNPIRMSDPSGTQATGTVDADLNYVEKGPGYSATRSAADNYESPTYSFDELDLSQPAPVCKTTDDKTTEDKKTDAKSTTPATAKPRGSAGHSISPPPPVSPPDMTLYVPKGYIATQYDEAIRGMEDSSNPLWARATFGVLATLAAPLAGAEELARGVLNTPYAVENAGIGIGEHIGRAYLWAQQGEYAEATVDSLQSIVDFSTGFNAAASVALPVAGALESKVATGVTGNLSAAGGGARSTYVYQLIDEAGEPVYYGISKDYRLLTRLGEHAESFGGNFRGMQVISDPLYQQEAKLLETQLIQENNPILNIANSSIQPPVSPLYVPPQVPPNSTLLNPALYGK